MRSLDVTNAKIKNKDEEMMKSLCNHAIMQSCTILKKV
jgi:hypothetical protein